MNALDDGYERLYGPLAVTTFVITFLPILPDGYGTLWQMAARDDGGPAVLALVLVYALIGCLLRMTLSPVRTGGWPLTVAGLAAVLALMLVLKPGTGTPTPDLTPYGHAAMGLALLTLTLGVAHVVRIRLHYRPSAAFVAQQQRPPL